MTIRETVRQGQDTLARIGLGANRRSIMDSAIDRHFLRQGRVVLSMGEYLLEGCDNLLRRISGRCSEMKPKHSIRVRQIGDCIHTMISTPGDSKISDEGLSLGQDFGLVLAIARWLRRAMYHRRTA